MLVLIWDLILLLLGGVDRSDITEISPTYYVWYSCRYATRWRFAISYSSLRCRHKKLVLPDLNHCFLINYCNAIYIWSRRSSGTAPCYTTTQRSFQYQFIVGRGPLRIISRFLHFFAFENWIHRTYQVHRLLWNTLNPMSLFLPGNAWLIAQLPKTIVRQMYQNIPICLMLAVSCSLKAILRISSVIQSMNAEWPTCYSRLLSSIALLNSC